MTAAVFNAPDVPLLDLNRLTLRVGNHLTPDDGVCVMEAVACVAGQPWSDRPYCVSPVIGRFLRRWNDTLPARPRQELKRHICPVIGTRTSEADEQARVALVWDWLIRDYAPTWLRLAELDAAAQALELLEPLGPATRDEARPALLAARRSAVLRALPGGCDPAVLAKAARMTGWDAALAVLVPSKWDHDHADLTEEIADRRLAADVALTSVGAASRVARTKVSATVEITRASTHQLVARLCDVGRRGKASLLDAMERSA